MPRITVGTENSAPIEIHYEDHGSNPRCTTRSSRYTTATRPHPGRSGPATSEHPACVAPRLWQHELDEAFTFLQRSLSDCTSYTFELQAHDVVGDMAYTAGPEHTSASVDGQPRSYTLRATQVDRREGGEWKVAHRHADTVTE
jgi:hypothetical protein